MSFLDRDTEHKSSSSQPTNTKGVNLSTTVKPVLSNHSIRPKIGFSDQLSLNAGQKYSRMLQGAFCNTFDLH